MVTITPEARIYALRELTRRAGIEPPFSSEWRIESKLKSTRLWVERDKVIYFPHASSQFWFDINRGDFHVERASWCHPAADDLLRGIPYFVVPFADREIQGPLFRMVDERHAECAVDLLSSIWLTLSRFEETLPGERDAHGRFTAAQSLAFKAGILNRPVIDEFGLAFEQILRALLPSWEPKKRELRVKLSHDIDHVGFPFRFRSTAGHVLARRKLGAASRDLLSCFTGIFPAHLQCVGEVVSIAEEYGLHSAVYWKNSLPSPFDSGYDLNHSKVRAAIEQLRDAGVELGVHPSYETFLNPGQLTSEVESMRNILQEPELGGRQHYLRWAPLTWQHWENCGLKYDSSVGFADHIGFRAGTCFPYRPWLLELNREADLLEIPLIVMEGTFPTYMKLGREEALQAACTCLERCRAVGGVFTFLWHNHAILDADLRWLYEELLRRVSGFATYDWRAEFHQSLTMPPHGVGELTTSLA